MYSAPVHRCCTYILAIRNFNRKMISGRRMDTSFQIVSNESFPTKVEAIGIRRRWMGGMKERWMVGWSCTLYVAAKIQGRLRRR